MHDRYQQPFQILIADDDEDDRFLTQEALKLCGGRLEMVTVSDGEELMQLLNHDPPYQNARVPDLILLDLNMPGMNGRECLMAIKGQPSLRRIPVVVLSTSREHEDVDFAYEQGVNAFISKPMSFKKLIDKMCLLKQYWFETVELPA